MKGHDVVFADLTLFGFQLTHCCSKDRFWLVYLNCTLPAGRETFPWDIQIYFRASLLNPLRSWTGWRALIYCSSNLWFSKGSKVFTNAALSNLNIPLQWNKRLRKSFIRFSWMGDRWKTTPPKRGEVLQQETLGTIYINQSATVHTYHTSLTIPNYFTLTPWRMVGG